MTSDDKPVKGITIIRNASLPTTPGIPTKEEVRTDLPPIPHHKIRSREPKPQPKIANTAVGLGGGSPSPSPSRSRSGHRNHAKGVKSPPKMPEISSPQPKSKSKTKTAPPSQFSKSIPIDHDQFSFKSSDPSVYLVHAPTKPTARPTDRSASKKTGGKRTASLQQLLNQLLEEEKELSGLFSDDEPHAPMKLKTAMKKGKSFSQKQQPLILKKKVKVSHPANTNKEIEDSDIQYYRFDDGGDNPGVMPEIPDVVDDEIINESQLFSVPKKRGLFTGLLRRHSSYRKPINTDFFDEDDKGYLAAPTVAHLTLNESGKWNENKSKRIPPQYFDVEETAEDKVVFDGDALLNNSNILANGVNVIKPKSVKSVKSDGKNSEKPKKDGSTKKKDKKDKKEDDTTEKKETRYEIMQKELVLPPEKWKEILKVESAARSEASSRDSDSIDDDESSEEDDESSEEEEGLTAKDRFILKAAYEDKNEYLKHKAFEKVMEMEEKEYDIEHTKRYKKWLKETADQDAKTEACKKALTKLPYSPSHEDRLKRANEFSRQMKAYNKYVSGVPNVKYQVNNHFYFNDKKKSSAKPPPDTDVLVNPNPDDVISLKKAVQKQLSPIVSASHSHHSDPVSPLSVPNINYPASEESLDESNHGRIPSIETVEDESMESSFSPSQSKITSAPPMPSIPSVPAMPSIPSSRPSSKHPSRHTSRHSSRPPATALRTVSNSTDAIPTMPTIPNDNQPLDAVSARSSVHFSIPARKPTATYSTTSSSTATSSSNSTSMGSSKDRDRILRRMAKLQAELDNLDNDQKRRDQIKKKLARLMDLTNNGGSYHSSSSSGSDLSFKTKRGDIIIVQEPGGSTTGSFPPMSQFSSPPSSNVSTPSITSYAPSTVHSMGLMPNIPTPSSQPPSSRSPPLTGVASPPQMPDIPSGNQSLRNSIMSRIQSLSNAGSPDVLEAQIAEYIPPPNQRNDNSSLLNLARDLRDMNRTLDGFLNMVIFVSPLFHFVDFTIDMVVSIFLLLATFLMSPREAKGRDEFQKNADLWSVVVSMGSKFIFKVTVAFFLVKLLYRVWSFINATGATTYQILRAVGILA